MEAVIQISLHRIVIRSAHATTPEEPLWGRWTNKFSVVDDYLHQRGFGPADPGKTTQSNSPLLIVI
ncbi:hypothetical protein [Nonomuraea sp. NPDC046570]|uniref:hypothetical protein n=1 Tax=Nonomuraea sp. NPDC046570 TaxID=3155255 RepID=UPI0033E81FB7